MTCLKKQAHILFSLGGQKFEFCQLFPASVNTRGKSCWNSIWFEFKKVFLDFLRICLEVQKQRYHSPTTVTLLVVVIIFIICQSARCAANLTDAILFLKLSPECQKDEDYVSMDGWSVILHTLSNILLAINRYAGSF